MHCVSSLVLLFLPSSISLSFSVPLSVPPLYLLPNRFFSFVHSLFLPSPLFDKCVGCAASGRTSIPGSWSKAKLGAPNLHSATRGLVSTQTHHILHTNTPYSAHNYVIFYTQISHILHTNKPYSAHKYAIFCTQTHHILHTKYAIFCTSFTVSVHMHKDVGNILHTNTPYSTHR